MTRWILVLMSGAICIGHAQTSWAEDLGLWQPPANLMDVSEPLIRSQDYCCSPGTLFQWSYGNSFGGGPDLDSPIVTDRPDFTEASSTVGLGVAQIEFGYTYTLNDDGGVRDIGNSIGEPLLRYGILAEWLELRFAVFPVSNNRATGAARNTTNGVEDLYLGLKIGLTPQECWLPEMALIPQATVPLGDPVFSDDQIQPGVNWVYAWELNDRFSTAGSSQFNRASDETTGDSYTEFAQSWTVGMSLTECVEAYAEWYALFPSGADTATPEHYFNGGFTYLLTDNVQYDVRAGVGLNEAADDYFVGTGLSVRFP